MLREWGFLGALNYHNSHQSGIWFWHSIGACVQRQCHMQSVSGFRSWHRNIRNTCAPAPGSGCVRLNCALLRLMASIRLSALEACNSGPRICQALMRALRLQAILIELLSTYKFAWLFARMGVGVATAGL